MRLFSTRRDATPLVKFEGSNLPFDAGSGLVVSSCSPVMSPYIEFQGSNLPFDPSSKLVISSCSPVAPTTGVTVSAMRSPASAAVTSTSAI